MAWLTCVALSACGGYATPLHPTASPPTLLLPTSDSLLPLVQQYAGAYRAAQLIPQAAGLPMSWQIGWYWSADVAWAAPLAQDAIALLVNPQNPVRGLSLEALRQILQGHLTDWVSVGGSEGSIDVLSRDAQHDSRLALERIVLGARPLASTARILPTWEAIFAELEQNPQALAAVPLGLGPEGAAILALDGILPSRESIMNGQYALRVTVYLMGPSEPLGNLRAWLVWAQSAAGQATLLPAYAPLPP